MQPRSAYLNTVRMIGDRVIIKTEGKKYKGTIIGITEGGLPKKMVDEAYVTKVHKLSYAIQLDGSSFPAYVTKSAIVSKPNARID